jgi:type I restriction-modification system DNA methylase subunit/predicted type IV restriction endonuclease
MTSSDSSKKRTKFTQINIYCSQFKHQLVQGRIIPGLSESKVHIPDNLRGSLTDLNEAQIRQSFILPLVQTLGWNTEDPFEVYPEERANGGFLDIRLRIPSGDSLIWEIKRASVSLDLGTESGKEAAYQGVGYARTFASSPFCVVTNFETTLVFHSYSLPPKENIMDNLVAKFNWLDLKDGDADIVLDHLSKTAVSSGVTRTYFDNAVKNKVVLKTSKPLEQRILTDLEKWRLVIAQELHRLVPLKTLSEIDLSTQNIINRLLFIRSCEDRRLEGIVRSKELLSIKDKWNYLTSSVFAYFRESYNSDLFSLDEIADDSSLKFSDEILKTIVEETYTGSGKETHEIYDFSIIPLEVLGSAYESYLGKQLDKNGSSLNLKFKPEVAKSGGVHYTPSYIVEEIILRTVGRLENLDKKYFLPKVLDPACGSGTFLIQSLRFILERNRPAPEKKSEKRKVLSLKEKRDILENCIYGVDLDKKATEITKLSLMLLLLEGVPENLLLKKALLPSLDKNIRHGNSLISPESAVRYLDEPDMIKIKPLDWETFKKNCGAKQGFDAVVGNPPYIRIQVLQEFYPIETSVYNQEYITASAGGVDIYLPFIELALKLTKKSGYVGYILPTRFWGNEYGLAARKLISEEVSFFEAINFRAEQVFKARTYTCILVLSKNNDKVIRVFEPEIQGISCDLFISKINEKKDSNVNILPQSVLTEDPWLLAPVEVRDRIHKLESSPKTLSNFIDAKPGIFQGLINGKDEVFLLKKDEESFYSESLNCKVELEDEVLFPVLKGSADIKKFKSPIPDLFLAYPYKLDENGNAYIISEDELLEDYPNLYTYFLANDEVLRFRNSLATAAIRNAELIANPKKFPVDPEDSSKKLWFYSQNDFYRYSRNQALNCVKKSKLIVPSQFKEPAFYWDSLGQFALTGSGSGGGGAYAMYLKSEFSDRALQLVGLLNSNVLLEWYQRRGDLFGGYYIGVDEKILLETPLPDLDAYENQEDLKAIAKLVDQIYRTKNQSTFLELTNSIDSVAARLFKI